MMLYFLMSSFGWLVVISLLVIMIALYIRLHQQLAQLRQDMAQLKSQFDQQIIEKQTDNVSPLQKPTSTHSVANSKLAVDESSTSTSTAKSVPPPLALDTSTSNFISTPVTQALANNSHPLADKDSTAPIEPDEHSFPIVTSLMYSIQNWFLGGNLVVRVGVLVLLVGVVLLLRLLSDLIQVPIGIKLIAIVIAGLGLAGLGLKLATKRFAYGISLQGAGLATAYL